MVSAAHKVLGASSGGPTGPLALDQTASNKASTVSSAAVTLTGAAAHSLIVLCVAAGSTPAQGAFTVSSVTATGLSFTQRSTNSIAINNVQYGTQRADVWWAAAPSGFTGSITANFSATVDDIALVAFSVTGAHTSSPFYYGSAIEVSNNSSSATQVLTSWNSTTSNVFGFTVGATPSAALVHTPQSTQTLIASVNNTGGTNFQNLGVDYEIATLSGGANAGFTDSSAFWVVTADAIH